jgi:SAM-dependent methyltransferase
MENSMTHHHICAVINTTLKEQAGPSLIRILDMGCGDGQLMAFLQSRLSHFREDLTFELYGFDVQDSHVQAPDYFHNTIDFIQKEFPDVDWRKRIHYISSRQEWPFPDGFFNYVISNQVMEHVFDHDFSLQQIRRVMAADGISIHLFPLKEYIFEGHLFLPFVHWISNQDLLFDYIKVCSLLGLGKYRKLLPQGTRSDLMDYCRKHADYMIHETNYLNQGKVYKLAKRSRLRCSFRYTEEYYLNKLRQLLGRPLKYEYALTRHPWREYILFSFFVRVASITLVLEKENTYSR